MPDKHFTQIKDELIRSTKLTPNEKAVLFVLLSYGNCKEIFVKQKTLAEQSNTSRASVIRALISLRKQGLVATKMKPDRSTLVYELTEEAVVSESNKGCVTEQQGVVAESDTSNRSISDRSLVIKKSKPKEESTLPDWLDKKTWAEWIQYRKEIKKTLKPSTIKKQIAKLEKDKDGHVEMINQSITNGWTGLFPLDNQTAGDKAKKPVPAPSYSRDYTQEKK